LTATGRIINIDTSVPTFTFANNSGYEGAGGSLSINGASDGIGIGLDAAPYAFSTNGTNR
jgi:hypothetical protein